MLPGGRALLGSGPDGLYVTNLETGGSELIGPGGSQGRYVPTGHVLYGDRTLQSVMAVPFDLETLTVTGSRVPVLPSVNVFGGGAVQLAVSDNGTLVHGLAIMGGVSGSESLTWIEMDGTRTDLTLEVQSGQIRAPRISPDGTRLAYEDDNTPGIWVYEFSTSERTQLADGLAASYPVWSTDGAALYFSTRQ
jgi:dipeptidyl aminopeptidase/acylaminoacyl peptidase